MRKNDLTVLCIDDEKIQLNLMKMTIEDRGYNVISCNDVTSALSIIETQQVDAIVTDYQMDINNEDSLNGDHLIKYATKNGFKGKIIYLTRENKDALGDFIALEKLNVSVVLKKQESLWESQLSTILHNTFTKVLYETTGSYKSC